MTKIFSRFTKEEDGATAIEYGLIAAILSVAIVGTVGAVKTELNETFSDVSTALSNGRNPGTGE